ncbi:(2Fe-2S) ferredoxin domain-containing protein [Magnetovibrio sp.]|uniref:(2Fe-2S) ferredoxin domain-containing protein n=1 Tax=Magnetovibrio sp. TaxID=2024836 RepID=UPI002F94300D
MSRTRDVKAITTVYVCTNMRIGGNSCANQKSKAVLKALQVRADARASAGGAVVAVRPSVCMGYCEEGPNVKIMGGELLHNVREDDVERVLDAAETVTRD